MAVSAPPKRNKETSGPAPSGKSDDKKIEAIINRGSSTVAEAPTDAQHDLVKTVTVKTLVSTLRAIDDLRARRPRKPTSPKLGISQADWIAEAIEEKIRRERKHYNMD